MPMLSFWFEECELRFRDRRLVEGEKGFCNLKNLHEHLQREASTSLVKIQRKIHPSPPLPPNTADGLQKEAAPVTFRNY